MKCKQQQQNANEIAVAILSAIPPLSLLDFLYLPLSPCLSLVLCASYFVALVAVLTLATQPSPSCSKMLKISLRAFSIANGVNRIRYGGFPFAPLHPAAIRHPLTHFCSPSCCLFLLAPANFQFSLHFACYPYPCHRHLYAVYWPISFYIFPSSALSPCLSWSCCICIQHRPTN